MVGSVIELAPSPPRVVPNAEDEEVNKHSEFQKPNTMDGTAAKLLILTSIISVVDFSVRFLPDKLPPLHLKEN